MSSSREIIPINMRDPFWKDPFFSSTWDDFDKMRQDMMARSKDFFGQADKDFGNFDEMVRKQHADMDRQMAPALPQLPAWAVPAEVKDKWAPMMTKEGDEVIKVNDTAKDKFEVTLDVSQYKPEELKVTTADNVLSVEGKHSESAETSSGDKAASSSSSSAVLRQFSRKWTLPADCKADEVVSNLSSDGVLMITAPRKGGPALEQQAQKAIR